MLSKLVLQCTNGVVRIPLIEEQIGTAVYQRCGSNPSDRRTNRCCSVPTVWFESLWLKNGVVRIPLIEEQIGAAVYQRCGSNPSDRRTNRCCSVPMVWFESLWLKNKLVLQCTNGVVQIPLIEEQIGTAVYQRCGSNPSDWRTNWYCSVQTVWFESFRLKNKIL